MNISFQSLLRHSFFERHKFSKYILIYGTELRIFSLIKWVNSVDNILRQNGGCGNNVEGRWFCR